MLQCQFPSQRGQLHQRTARRNRQSLAAPGSPQWNQEVEFCILTGWAVFAESRIIANVLAGSLPKATAAAEKVSAEKSSASEASAELALPPPPNMAYQPKSPAPSGGSNSSSGRVRRKTRERSLSSSPRSKARSASIPRHTSQHTQIHLQI